MSNSWIISDLVQKYGSDTHTDWETLIFSFDEESKEFWKFVIKQIKEIMDSWLDDTKDSELYNAVFDLSLKCLTGDCEDYLHDLENDELERTITANVEAVITLLTCNKFSKSGIEVFGKTVDEIVDEFILEEDKDE